MPDLLTALRRLLSPRRPPPERPPDVPAPVSDALDVERGPHDRPLRDALAAVDAVHTDGRLPRIPIRRLALSRKLHGHFRHRLGGPPLDIGVHPAARHAALTAVHEIGHFLDYSGLGEAGFGSVAGDLLGPWRAAVRNSAAVQRLGQLWRFTESRAREAQDAGGADGVKYAVELRYIEYLLQNEELWARSYAQFIAVKSGHPALREQLDRLRQRPERRLYHGPQWDDEDFLPIMTEIEAAFRQKGWMG